MTANVGTVDRALRVVVGLVLLALALFGGHLWGWIGLVPLALRAGIQPILAMAIGTLVGGLGQVFLQWPALRREGYRYAPRIDVHDPALRQVLGEHVQQKGSQVDPDKTRFDFVHTQPMTNAQIREVENIVNAEILANAACETRVLPIEEAQKLGAMMLFGEKYGEEVRVLSMGSDEGGDKYSVELCGGTHARRTGDIGLFRIISEEGLAAGVRRIEAVAGKAAIERASATSAKPLARHSTRAQLGMWPLGTGVGR